MLTSNLFFKLKQLYPYQFNQVISEYNNDIYGYQNDHAYIPTGPRINSHAVATSAPIGIQDPLIPGNAFDDPDLVDPYYDYDHNFAYSGINQGMVNGAPGHIHEIGFGSGPTTG